MPQIVLSMLLRVQKKRKSIDVYIRIFRENQNANNVIISLRALHFRPSKEITAVLVLTKITTQVCL